MYLFVEWIVWLKSSSPVATSDVCGQAFAVDSTHICFILIAAWMWNITKMKSRDQLLCPFLPTRYYTLPGHAASSSPQLATTFITLRMFWIVCLPEGSSSPDWQLVLSGPAGGMRQHLPGHDRWPGDVRAALVKSLCERLWTRAIVVCQLWPLTQLYSSCHYSKPLYLISCTVVFG